MSHLIVGTAGHIDHGKTTLVRALTGIDTDRLKEEKERGITIELGFAHLDLPGLPPVGIVDVPGHERFVHHMVAGVAGIDLVLLVIAADEGVMPQTREHLDICRLLGVGRGLVALTKADLVEPDWLEMVRQDVADFLAGSFLEGAPVVEVSAPTGRGVDALRSSLAALLASVPPRETAGIPRLPVDRVFTMKGFGTVVTGTLISGTLRAGEQVELLPEGVACRIRGLQVYGAAVQEARAGQRTAVNLQGVEKAALERGSVLTRPGLLRPSYLMDARLLCLPSAPRPIGNRARVRLHVGTSEILARVVLLGRAELRPGEEAMVQFRLETPGVALPRDRFVVRAYSPLVTLGGGELVDTSPAKHRQFSEAALEHVRVMAAADPASAAPLLVREAGLAGSASADLAGRLNLEESALARTLGALVKSGELRTVPGSPPLWVHRDAAVRFEERALEILGAFHRAEPLRPGLAKEELRSKLPDAGPRVFAALLEDLARRGTVCVEKDLVRLGTHRVQLRTDQEELKRRIEGAYRRAGLQVPALDALGRELGVGPKPLRDAVGLLVSEGRLAKVSEELLVHEEHMEAARSKTATYLRESGRMAVPEFKDLVGVSRKYALPLLEFFDRTGFTIRVGDHRVLRKSG